MTDKTRMGLVEYINISWNLRSTHTARLLTMCLTRFPKVNDSQLYHDTHRPSENTVFLKKKRHREL